MRVESDVPPALIPHQVFRGGDLDQALEVSTQVVNPHTARVLGERGDLDVQFFASRVGAVTLAYLGLTPAVSRPRSDGRESIVSDAAMLSVPAPVDPQVVGRTREAFPVLDDRYATFAAEGNRASAVALKGALTR